MIKKENRSAFLISIIFVVITLITSISMSGCKNDATSNAAELFTKINDKKYVENVNKMNFINLEIIVHDTNNDIFRDKNTDVLYSATFIVTEGIFQNHVTTLFTPIAKPDGFLTYEEWRLRNEQKE